MKQQTIRVHDFVRVVNKRAVKRVGYPLHYKDVMVDLRNNMELRQKYIELINFITTLPGSTNVPPRVNTSRVVQELFKNVIIDEDFLKLVARQYTYANKFGGNNRIIHYYTDQELDDLGIITEGDRFEVTEIITRYTGTRVAPSQYYDHYTGESDYDPGGLDNRKTIRLYRLRPENTPIWKTLAIGMLCENDNRHNLNGFWVAREDLELDIKRIEHAADSSKF